MSKAQRDKGKRGERQVAEKMRAYFPWLNLRRGWQARAGRDECDVEGHPRYWIESKLGKAPNIHAAYTQAAHDTDGRTPIAVTRRNREEALVTMNLNDWCEIARDAEAWKMKREISRAG